jgi:phosphopantetheinyl transferase
MENIKSLLGNIRRTDTTAANVFITDVSELDIKKALNLVSQGRIEKINRLKKESAKKLSAGAELLLMYAAREITGREDFDVSYTADKRGKPYFTIEKDLYFSLSHSGSLVSCVISPFETGVDVQYVRKTDIHIVEKYFTKDEQSLIGSNISEFTRLWARKEAAAKADGAGIAIGLDSLDVSSDIVVSGSECFLVSDIDTKIGSYKAAAAIRLAP